MILYHFTSGRHLRAIHLHGLTVGDVPTDIEHWRGCVGVWFTSSEMAPDHGLEGSAADKTRYRLSVDIPAESPLLVKWIDWARGNVTAKTIEVLHRTASGYESWFVFFGVVPTAAILQCVDVATGLEVANWADCSPPEFDVKGVPPWRRDAWHRRLLKQTKKQLLGI